MLHAKTKQQGVVALPSFPDGQGALKIVTAYDDFPAGMRAKELVQSLVARLNSLRSVGSDVWKFEFIADPRFWECAVAGALGADLIVISCRGDVPLPAHIKTWITCWLPERTSRSAVLLALLDQEPAPLVQAQPVYAFLRQTASLGRMDFFCKAGDWQRQLLMCSIEAPHYRLYGDSAVAAGTLQGRLISHLSCIRKAEAPRAPLPGSAWSQAPESVSDAVLAGNRGEIDERSRNRLTQTINP